METTGRLEALGFEVEVFGSGLGLRGGCLGLGLFLPPASAGRAHMAGF